jgi:hypothetical protein
MLPEDDPELPSYFSGQYNRLPKFNGVYNFGPLLGNHICGWTPENFEYIDQSGPNMFKDLQQEGPHDPIPIHLVFRSVWNDEAQKVACLEQLAWTLLHRVQSLTPFYFSF